MSPRHARIPVLCRVAPIPLFRLVISPQWCSGALGEDQARPFQCIGPAGPVTRGCEELGFGRPALGVWAPVEPWCPEHCAHVSAATPGTGPSGAQTPVSAAPHWPRDPRPVT